ncbi:Ku protein [Streptomyces sp. G44]|uniref:non-homologous end joining protein Ku n=1 Tax=Streptomyces sp. G44 TaxID=2807632 RepID=UPI0019618FEE|nr:Ku protein [Streptomyces sp. G44]MBM7166835.1 Ku protein [Streptomyces sp. G44]
MARSIWSGVLTFGLVTVPVGLFTATEDHTIHFHQLERGTGDRIRYKRINERTGKEVDSRDIVKGYDLGDGEYVVIEPEELDDISPGKSKVVDMTGFVDLDRIEPVYFDRTYYVAPRGKEYLKVYELLRAALEEANKAGIATFTMRGKQYLTALRAQENVLVLHTMRWADEVRDPRDEVETLPDRRQKVTSRELRTARQLIDALTVDWNPRDYHDTFEERVKELVAAKREGKEIVTEAGPPEATNVIDLMSALKESVERNRAKGAGDAKGGPGQAQERKRERAQEGDVSALTKSELYRRATDAKIPGRSKMTREQLVEALGKGRAAA